MEYDNNRGQNTTTLPKELSIHWIELGARGAWSMGYGASRMEPEVWRLGYEPAFHSISLNRLVIQDIITLQFKSDLCYLNT